VKPDVGALAVSRTSQPGWDGRGRTTTVQSLSASQTAFLLEVVGARSGQVSHPPVLKTT
jgi:hypothetical protein